MEFTRGDQANHGFSILAELWAPGGRLFFAAKPAIDDDNTDANALIQGDWGDDAVTDTVREGIAYKRYDCVFPPAATNNIASGGAESAEYLGEFQWVPVTGIPVTFPATDEKIKTTVYFDVKRKTTV